MTEDQKNGSQTIRRDPIFNNINSGLHEFKPLKNKVCEVLPNLSTFLYEQNR